MFHFHIRSVLRFHLDNLPCRFASLFFLVSVRKVLFYHVVVIVRFFPVGITLVGRFALFGVGNSPEDRIARVVV